MEPSESKSNQLRVRVTADERAQLEKLRLTRDRGETISDLVREAISLLLRGGAASNTLSPKTQEQVQRLAVLLKREPQQVEEACIEGVLDLIDMKCEMPLIVMETHLHMKYRNRDEKSELTWTEPEENAA